MFRTFGHMYFLKKVLGDGVLVVSLIKRRSGQDSNVHNLVLDTLQPNL